MDLTTLIDLDKQLLLTLNGSESLFLDSLVRTLTHAATWIPFYLSLFYLVLKNNDNFQKVMLILGCAGLCTLLAGTLNVCFIKPEVARWRPGRDTEIAMLVDVVNDYRGGSYGFFSSHASNTFSIAVFFAWLVRSRALTLVMVLWSLTNCWTRMYLGVHYPGDILCGLLWGAVVGTAVWYLHHRLKTRFWGPYRFISTQYTTTGYQLSDVHIVITVLVLTLIFAILKACLSLYI